MRETESDWGITTDGCRSSAPRDRNRDRQRINLTLGNILICLHIYILKFCMAHKLNSAVTPSLIKISKF